MGAKSTIEITRKDALDFIDRLLKNKISDEELEKIMEILYGDKLLYNYSIVEYYSYSSTSPFDDVRWSHENMELL